MNAEAALAIACATMSLVFVLWCVTMLALSLWGAICEWRRRG